MLLLKTIPGWTQPTPAQAEAGNYFKPRVQWNGLEIAIENPAGTIRSGEGWQTMMKHHYGYVCRSEAMDGDEVDVYLGPYLFDAPMVYVVHQRRRGDWEAYDEDKAMLGFFNEEAARQAYLEHYDDSRYLGEVTAMPVAEFVEKVRATRREAAMIKATQPLVLFFKAHVGPYMRGGKMVNLQGYHGRDARAQAAPGQMSLFGGTNSGKPMGPSPYKGKDPVKDTIDLFDGVTHNERADASDTTAPIEKEQDDPAVSVVEKKKVRDPLSGTETHVTLSNGKTHRIQRLNATESMGLPGWHDLDGGYLADTEDAAISVLVGGHDTAASHKIEQVDGEGPNPGGYSVNGRRFVGEDHEALVDEAKEMAVNTGKHWTDVLSDIAPKEHFEAGEPTPAEPDHLLADIPGAKWRRGKGRIAGHYGVEVDGEAMGNYHEKPEAAVAEAKQWLANRKASKVETERRAAALFALKDRLLSGGEVGDADLKMLGLRDGSSGLEWFIPAAAELFGISSRQVRPLIAEMIRTGHTDMGAKKEFVTPNNALQAMAAKLKPAPAETDDHPAPMPRSMLGMVPEDKRDEWKALHRQQHELHHYELGQVREKMDRHRSKMNRAQSALRETEANMQSLRSAPVPDREREAAVQKHVDQAHAEFTKLARQYDALVGQHQSLHERVAKLGREKERIAAGTGDMDVDFAAMRKRTASEQQEHERSMLKMYRQHYKAAKGEPITKSILFLRRPAS